jgi:phosphinothricin acetyltransferase
MLAFPDPMTEIHIRRAVRADCSGILDIYNDAVLKTTATYDYEPRPLEHRLAWFEDHQRTGHAIFVAESADGRIVGWSALNRYHDRMGFRFTAENSIYVAEGARGQGLGARLLDPLIPAAAEIGIRAILAAIDAQNTASIQLHVRFGFEQVGLFKRVGFKFDRWLDVAYMERWV